MTGIVVLILRIALTIALYSFLGWALYVLWRDLRQQGDLLSKQKVPNVQLAWYSGTDVSQKEFQSAEILIGRDPSVDCPIQNETISARHARLSYHHKQWWLEDLNSTNGTFLNQAPVDIPTVIVSGDEFQCGQVNLFVTIPDK